MRGKRNRRGKRRRSRSRKSRGKRSTSRSIVAVKSTGLLSSRS